MRELVGDAVPHVHLLPQRRGVEVGWSAAAHFLDEVLNAGLLASSLIKWLGNRHDSTGMCYPGIVLNAVSWATDENRFEQITAPADSPIPANDNFGQAPALPSLFVGLSNRRPTVALPQRPHEGDQKFRSNVNGW